jgi:hypothetical protein
MTVLRDRMTLAADWLTAGLVVLSAAVAVGGGFRLHFGAVRLSFTGGGRLLLAAVAIAVLRHWFVRQPTLLGRIRTVWATAMAFEPLRLSFPVWAGTRLAVGIVGLLAVLIVDYPQTSPPPLLSENKLVNLPYRWDAGWYANIAAGGYDWHPDSTRQQDIAFFPALPLLMRVGATILGGSSPAFFWAGVLVSHAAFLWALVYFCRLALREEVLGDRQRARMAVALIGSYPFAVFYGAVYTEALWLLTCVGAFWHALRGEWGRCTIWGIISGLTRPNGCLLSIALTVLVFQRLRRRAASERVGLALVGAASPAIGLMLFAAYIYWLTGNPFQWALVHEAWGRGGIAGLQELEKLFAALRKDGFWVWLDDLTPEIMNMTAATVGLALTWPVARRFGLAYAAFVVVNLLAPLLSGGTLSAGRVTSTLFPIFLWLAAVLPERQLTAWVAAFAIGQGLMAVLFYTWRPPY